jgi:uncharacterized protein YraI
VPAKLQRVILVLMTALLPLGSLALAPAGVEAQTALTATTTDALNMRTGAGMNHPVILVIPFGETVTVRGDEQAGFLPIRYAGRDGWASKYYLALSKRPSATEIAGTTTESLNLRSGPTVTSPVIVVIPSGASVVVTGESTGGYLAVTWSGFKGYAHSDWIRTGGTPQPEPPSQPVLPVAGTATTTAALNLRAGAGTGFTVLAVMPQGATVNLTGQSANGFYGLTWNGRTGWAAAEYLRVSSGQVPPPTTPSPTPAPTQPPASGARTAVATDDLNMRTGAGLGNPVILVIPTGATVSLTGGASNGFLQVTYNGLTGWSSQEWLRVSSGTAPTPSPTPAPTPVPPVTSTKGTGITTDALNMRTGAATTFPVILVIPASATVQLTGTSSGNFLEVTYGGRTGWAHKDWVRPQVTETRPTSSARVLEDLNMRSGPATSYSVVTVMRAGVTVVLTGQESNGFHSVTYNGKTGWAFGTYLDITPPTAPQPTIPPTPIPTAVPPTPVPTAVPTQPSQPVPTPNPVGVVPKPWPQISSNQGYHWTNTIEGPTRGTAIQAIAFAQNAGAVRMDEVERYINEIYRFAPQLGFDPSLLVAQSALETGYWKSYWWRERLNPAGLSLNDDPSTHAASPGFLNGTIAARAQMAHMHAEVFGDRKELPDILQGVDISYEAVFKAGWAGDIVTLEDLGGTWATDTSYGYKIARVAAEIFG